MSVLTISLSSFFDSGRISAGTVPTMAPQKKGRILEFLIPPARERGDRAGVDPTPLSPNGKDSPPEGIPGVREAGSLPDFSRHYPAVQVHHVLNQCLRVDPSHWDW